MLKRTRPANQANGPRRHLRATAAALMVAGALGMGGASQAANPFNSPGPIIFQGTGSPMVVDLLIAQMPVGTTTLELFITNGNDPNPAGPENVCVADNDSSFLGDGICAFSGEVLVTGNGYIADFRPVMLGPSMPVFAPTTLGPGVTQVGFNWTEVTAPLEAPWAHKFAEIDIEVTAPGQTQVWASGGSGNDSLVDATFETSDFETNVIALPEPGALWLLPSAWAGLALLYRVRRRSRQ